ncbi:MAG: hypothetical protein ACTS43_01675 [Candidatus Hodgkinia cicadicola]
MLPALSGILKFEPKPSTCANNLHDGRRRLRSETAQDVSEVSFCSSNGRNNEANKSKIVESKLNVESAPAQVKGNGTRNVHFVERKVPKGRPPSFGLQASTEPLSKPLMTDGTDRPSNAYDR